VTSTLVSRDEVARVGALVRAADRIDAAHTDRGEVIALNAYAPVALVRFACGCVAYVPLRRLILDQGPTMTACEVAGCGRPRWEGPYCPSHPRGAPTGASFEPKAQATHDGRFHPHAQSGRADIDDLGNHGATGGPPSPNALQPRATGTAAARTGVGGSHRPLAPVRRTWTAGEITQALTAWAAEHGRAPSFADWKYADPAGRRPTASTVRDHFGSWLAGLTSAGLEARSSAPKSRWTREAIIEAIRAHHARTGQAPSRRGWAEKSDAHPWPATVVAVCGSWSDAIREAGFEPARPGRPRRRQST